MIIKFNHYLSLAILLIISLAPYHVNADEAPIDLTGCGSHAVFINQTNITMERFHVNVTVNLPSVREEYIYYLRNDVNRTINQTVIVPIIFELYKSEYHEYDEKGDIQIWINGDEVNYYSTGSVLLEENDLMIDMDYYEGVVFNLSFNPYETIVTRLIITSKHDDYTAEFKYYYSSKTARYWNGTVSHSSFRFQFIGDVDWIKYSVPNGSKNNNIIYSEMNNWDANAEYKITVNLHHEKGNKFFMIQTIIVIVVLGIVACIIFAIKIGNRNRKEKNIGKEHLDKYFEEEKENEKEV